MAGIRRDSKGRDRVLVKDQRYQWSMWLGIFLILFCSLFILKAGFDGRFHSVDTLQEYIRSFGHWTADTNCDPGLSGGDSGSSWIPGLHCGRCIVRNRRRVLVQLYRDQSRLADRLYSGPGALARLWWNPSFRKRIIRYGSNGFRAPKAIP